MKTYLWFTPRKGRIMLYRYGEWLELYKGEAILAHKDHYEELTQLGFKIIKTPTVCKTIKEVLATKGISLKKTE